MACSHDSSSCEYSFEFPRLEVRRAKSVGPLSALPLAIARSPNDDMALLASMPDLDSLRMREGGWEPRLRQ